MKHIKAINQKAVRIEEYGRSEPGTGTAGGPAGTTSLRSKPAIRDLISPWDALSCSLPGGKWTRVAAPPAYAHRSNAISSIATTAVSGRSRFRIISITPQIGRPPVRLRSRIGGK